MNKNDPTHVRFAVIWEHRSSGVREEYFRYDGERLKIPILSKPDVQEGDRITAVAEFYTPTLARALSEGRT